MRACRCDLRTKLVGDGCDICNPSYAAERSPKRRQRRPASPWQPRGNGEHVLSVGDIEAVIFQAADGFREWNVAIGGRVCTNAHGREGFPSRAQAEDVAFTRATIAARKRA